MGFPAQAGADTFRGFHQGTAQEDIRQGLEVVRDLAQIGQEHRWAVVAYRADLRDLCADVQLWVEHRTYPGGIPIGVSRCRVLFRFDSAQGPVR